MQEIVTTLNALRIPHVIVGNKRDLDGNASLPVELEKSQNHFTVSAKEVCSKAVSTFIRFRRQTASSKLSATSTTNCWISTHPKVTLA